MSFIIPYNRDYRNRDRFQRVNQRNLIYREQLGFHNYMLARLFKR